VKGASEERFVWCAVLLYLDKWMSSEWLDFRDATFAAGYTCPSVLPSRQSLPASNMPKGPLIIGCTSNPRVTNDNVQSLLSRRASQAAGARE